MKSLEQIILRIAPDKFHYLKFILEGYDNMAILSSLHSKEGLVVVKYPKKLAKDLFTLLADIGSKLA